MVYAGDWRFSPTGDGGRCVEEGGGGGGGSSGAAGEEVLHVAPQLSDDEGVGGCDPDERQPEHRRQVDRGVDLESRWSSKSRCIRTTEIRTPRKYRGIVIICR